MHLSYILLLTLSGVLGPRETRISNCSIEERISLLFVNVEHLLDKLTNNGRYSRTKIDSLIILHSPRFILKKEDFEYPLLKDVTSIRLEGTNISTFDSETMRGLKKLNTLSLKENNLININETTFEDLTSLTHLSLEGNKIVNIRESSFRNLINLSELNLRDNSIVDISNCFQGHSSLQALLLGNNKISGIERDTFKGLYSLNKLDLSNNALRTLDKATFGTNRNLQELRLSLNQLERLEPGLFANNTQLRFLDLSHIRIESLHDFPLYIASLEKLKIGYCNIRTIPSDYLANVPQLRHLHLDGNRLESLEAGVFTSATHLQKIFLNRNKFKSLSVEKFAELYFILKERNGNEGYKYEVMCKENPWDCTTRDMIGLRNWCRERSIPFYTVFKCREQNVI